jgi:hypothetical protein
MPEIKPKLLKIATFETVWLSACPKEYLQEIVREQQSNEIGVCEIIVFLITYCLAGTFPHCFSRLLSYHIAIYYDNKQRPLTDEMKNILKGGLNSEEENMLSKVKEIIFKKSGRK